MTSDPVDGAALVSAIGADLVVGTIGAMPETVVDLTHDSRQVAAGWAFACVPGSVHDGHGFAGSAVAAGATLLIVERPIDPIVVGEVAQIVVTDVRRAMARAACAVHGDPSRSLSMVGVTGTNGKTTTAHLIGAVLASAGREVRVLGTLTAERTTPESTDLQRTLAQFVRSGVESVVMEVSSHALTLHRVDGITFDVALFTNLGRDHLDLHGSMAAYFDAKASLFRSGAARRGVVNVDDPYGRKLRDMAEIPMVASSVSDVTDLSVGVDTIRFRRCGRDVVAPMGGSFNVSNVLAAMTAAESLGVDPDDVLTGIAAATSVPGRFEVVSRRGSDDIVVVVDYAHTPDGLDEVLRAARPLVAGRLVVVFGCGGDRDREKRSEMGRVAVERADVVVVTSDNPRSEHPTAIIDDIVGGVPDGDRGRVVVESERRAAIDRTIADAGPGDVIVIAGKGHEATQDIAGVRHEFDDRVVARAALERRDG